MAININFRFYKSDVTALESDISTLQTNVADNTADIAANTAEITEVKADVAVNATGISKNNADIAAISKDVADNKANVALLQTNVTSNANEISKNKSAITQLQTDMTSNGSNISTLQSDIATINTTLFDKQSKADDDLDTNDKTIVGAINSIAGVVGTKAAYDSLILKQKTVTEIINEDHKDLLAIKQSIDTTGDAWRGTTIKEALAEIAEIIDPDSFYHSNYSGGISYVTNHLWNKVSTMDGIVGDGDWGQSFDDGHDLTACVKELSEICGAYSDWTTQPKYNYLGNAIDIITGTLESLRSDVDDNKMYQGNDGELKGLTISQALEYLNVKINELHKTINS